MSNARNYTKKAVNAVVTTVVAFTTTNALKSTTVPTSKLQTVEILVGSYIIGAFVSEKLGDWTDLKVDAAFDWYEATFPKTA